MYFSRLIINPRNAQVRHELTRPYEMHRTILRAFKQGAVHIGRDDDDAAGVLFRVDEQPCENRFTVLVQSQTVPDWAYLNDISDVRGHSYLIMPAEYKSFLLKLTVGQALVFRLRANPTKRLGKSAGDTKGKRVGVYGEDEQLKWLEEKFHGNQDKGRPPTGFRLVRKQISHDEKIKDKPTQENTRPALEFLSVQFDGMLKVENATLACQTVKRGIGSAKGFGFGLLSIAPVKG